MAMSFCPVTSLKEPMREQAEAGQELDADVRHECFGLCVMAKYSSVRQSIAAATCLQRLHDMLQHILLVGFAVPIGLSVSPSLVQVALDVAVQPPHSALVLQLRQGGNVGSPGLQHPHVVLCHDWKVQLGQDLQHNRSVSIHSCLTQTGLSLHLMQSAAILLLKRISGCGLSQAVGFGPCKANLLLVKQGIKACCSSVPTTVSTAHCCSKKQMA